MSTFILSIPLTPTGLHSGDDVQRALALTGAELANRYDGLTLPDHLTGTIRDNHGAAVGTWSTKPALTADGTERFYGMDLDEEDGHVFPFGPETHGIVDEEQGGIIAYCHESNTLTIVDALRKATA